jgi:hypothetical protein
MSSNFLKNSLAFFSTGIPQTFGLPKGICIEKEQAREIPSSKCVTLNLTKNLYWSISMHAKNPSQNVEKKRPKIMAKKWLNLQCEERKDHKTEDCQRHNLSQLFDGVQ